MSLASPIALCTPFRTPQMQRIVLLALAASSLGLLSCGAPDEGYDGTAARPQAAAAPTDPYVLALLSKLPAADQLPHGFSITGIESSSAGAASTRNGAIGKATWKLSGTYGADAQRVSYTVFPDNLSATAAFASIGEPVDGRNVTKAEPITATEFAAPVWGEVSHESYGGRTFIRTSVATTSGRCIALAQISTESEGPVAGSTDDSIKLLRAAVAHLASLPTNAVPPTDGL
jgi:hypothetical protein